MASRKGRNLLWQGKDNQDNVEPHNRYWKVSVDDPSGLTDTVIDLRAVDVMERGVVQVKNGV